MKITSLKGAGSKTAELLANLDIFTTQDLLFHLPIRYEDRSKIYFIVGLKPGDRVLIEGTVDFAQFVGRRHYLKCVLSDASGASIDLIFYHLVHVHHKRLVHARSAVRCFGEVRIGFSGHLEMVHPEYIYTDELTENNLLSLSPCLSPVYSTTKGLSQITLRKLMRQALPLLQQENFLPELLPDSIINKNNFLPLCEALAIMHFPPININLEILLDGKHPAQQRFIFEELMAHQLGLQNMRHYTQLNTAIALPHTDNLSKKLLAQLPFQLTGAQQRVIDEIEKDMMQTVPMLRLMQGDVGSGKTIVACFAALNAIEAGYQVALMAPTEILCEQHYQHFSQWLTPLNIQVDLLLGRHTNAEQNKIKLSLISGEIKLIIGTHALFQDDVEFKNLCLFIIDEQHRFGVNQRLALMEKGLKIGYFPHQLIMTATPIPRTLSMTAYADLDFSVIDELPPGRKPISTALISSAKRDEIISRLHANCKLKKQAYWICTLIEESDVLQCQAAETTAQYLQDELKDLRVRLIHGRLSSEEKNAAMSAFSRGEIDLLVATTVVEVGVDVANASLMIIENPERLGLAQLHQLRGRIGRGNELSFCVLLYQHPLSEIAKKRLMLMRETQDGFAIAEADLEMRGPGEMLGARQSGLVQLRVADLIRDQYLLKQVKDASEFIVKEHPDLSAKLMQRWIGSEMKYLKV